MSKKQRPPSEPKTAAAPSRLAEYFWANAIFFGVVLVLAFLVRKSCEAPGDDMAVGSVLDQAFKFFLLLMGGGFLLVTLFDAGYETFAAKAEEDTQA